MKEVEPGAPRVNGVDSGSGLLAAVHSSRKGPFGSLIVVMMAVWSVKSRSAM